MRGREGTGDPVIAEVMSENDIDPLDVSHAKDRGPFDPDNPQSIRGSQRFILVRGYAWHRQHESPTGCSRWWASAHSWCVIDLKKQKIIHGYGQYCKKCGGKSTPSFEEEAKRRMAEYACRTHLYRTGRLRGGHRSFPNMTDLSGVREGHHDMLRCDMCKLLGHSCQSQGAAEVRRPSTPSSPSSQESDSPVESFDPTLMLGCSFCGGSGHSYLSCSVRRHQQELEERHPMRHAQPTEIHQRQPQTLTSSQPAVSRANQSVETSRTHSATASSASGRRGLNVSNPGDFQLQTKTDPTQTQHCSFCGRTGHSYLSCYLRRHEQELAESPPPTTQPTTEVHQLQLQALTLNQPAVFHDSQSVETNRTHSATAASSSGRRGPNTSNSGDFQLQTTARSFDTTQALCCSFCGRTGHSYLSCSLRRHQQKFQESPSPTTRHTQPTNSTDIHQLQPQTLTSSQPTVSHANQSVETSRTTHSATASSASGGRQLNVTVSNPGEFQLKTTAKLGVAVVRSAVAKVGTLLFKRKS